MKRTSILLATSLLLGFASCGNKTPNTVESQDSIVAPEVLVDSAFAKSAAGDYLSYDLQRTITLNADGTITTKGVDQEYTAWELATLPKEGMAEIKVCRKGIDAVVKDPGAIDLNDGRLLIKDETYRKRVQKKK